VGFGKLIGAFEDLEESIRFPGRFTFRKHTVAAHSFRVTQYAQILGEIESANGAVIDWKSLYEKALNHDVAEAWAGDLRTDVKYAKPEMKKIYSQIEEMMVGSFVENEIPAEFQAIWLKKLSEGKDDTLEGKILSVTDKMDQLFESLSEIRLGNRHEVFIKVYKDALRFIKGVDLVSVRYFIEVILAEILEDEVLNSQINLKAITYDVLREKTR
jgi:putative hydrolase of HD superfamily